MFPTRRVCLLLLAAAALCVIASAGCKPEQGKPPPNPKPVAPSPEEGPQRLQTATIRIGSARQPSGHGTPAVPGGDAAATPVDLLVEVANTEATRQKGMMFRERLAPDEAMLFVYPRERDLAFWMKNTLVDLDLAYISADGRLFQIEHMYAHNLEGVRGREPAQFVLEVPAGWFARHAVAEGTKVDIPREVAASARE